MLNSCLSPPSPSICLHAPPPCAPPRWPHASRRKPSSPPRSQLKGDMMVGTCPRPLILRVQAPPVPPLPAPPPAPSPTTCGLPWRGLVGRSPVSLHRCVPRRRWRTPPPLQAATQGQIPYSGDERGLGSVVFGRDGAAGWAAGGEGGSQDQDTIAAVVTGAQQGSVAIIRVSGPRAVQVAGAVFRPAGARDGDEARAAWAPESHRVQFGRCFDGEGALLDEVLAIPMLQPRSYTAEDVVELHCHGGAVCVQRVMAALLQAGARRAQPGEFTLRAFLNGRLDLSQAESVAQLLSSRTVAAAESALAGMAGGIAVEIREVRAECVDLLVEMEARIDFDDELPDLDAADLVARLRALEARVGAAAATGQRGRLLQQGLSVALVGQPNVGKSSLLNRWCRSERAIVTDIPGTTRDVVEGGVVVDGIPLQLLDTAGMRDTEDVVESMGVERSVAAARGADVVVMVADAGRGWGAPEVEVFESIWGPGGGGGPGAGSGGDRRQLASAGDLVREGASAASPSPSPFSAAGSSRAPGLLVLNKADESDAAAAVEGIPEVYREHFKAVVSTCAVTGAGMEQLEAAVLEVVGGREAAGAGAGASAAWAVNERQAEALARAQEALGRVAESVAAALPVDFWTIDVRDAAIALGEVTGDEVAEEVLSGIFSRFCIGK